MIRTALLWAVAHLGIAATSLNAQVLVDDFDDGNDDGWTHLNPLEDFGGSVDFTFPDGNSYRIEAGTSPNPGALGGGRGAAFLPDVYTDSFYVAVDLIDWNDNLEQDVGLLAFMENPGPGTLTGYALSYDVDEGAIYLGRLDNEEPTSLGGVDVPLDPMNSYRLVFQGFMGQLRGDVIDLADPEFPLVSLSGFDSAYTMGTSGVFVADGSDNGGGTGDATFDNYRSSTDTDVDFDGMSDQWEFEYLGDLFYFEDEDPDGDGQTNIDEFIGGSDPMDAGSLSGISSISVADGTLTVNFPLTEGRSYLLETSPDLEAWTARPGATFSAHEESASLAISLPPGGQNSLFARVVATVD